MRRHAQPLVKRRRVVQQGLAVGAVGDATAVEHDAVVGDAQHHVRMLLDDDGRQALLARHAADGTQQLLDDEAPGGALMENTFLLFPPEMEKN